MQKMRFIIVRKRINASQSLTNNVSLEMNRYLRRKFNTMMDNDVVPLVIAPIIFILFAGLEWWHWYLGLQTPYPALITITALALAIFCFYKRRDRKMYEDEQIDASRGVDRHIELH